MENANDEDGLLHKISNERAVSGMSIWTPTLSACNLILIECDRWKPDFNIATFRSDNTGVTLGPINITFSKFGHKYLPLSHAIRLCVLT